MKEKKTKAMKRQKLITQTKSVRGITLIALVITIIVLLILAGVSIAMLTGENGILTQATNAKNRTEEAEEMEKIQLAVSEAQLGNSGYQKLTKENLQKEIDEQFGSGEVKVYANEKNAFSFMFQNKEANYRLEKDGTLNKIDIALKINNVGEFKSFMTAVNSGNTYEGQYVYLMDNMDLSSETWDVIGSYTDDTTNNAFAGIFEGNNMTINGLDISKEQDYVGLFAYNTGTIRDIILESGNITGQGRVGGITAVNAGTIENCHNKGVAINITGASGGGGGGGIATRNTGNMIYCSNVANINAENSSYVGGIAGSSNSGLIACCYNKGNIEARSILGGITGENYKDSIIEYCYNEGNITGYRENYTYGGGIAGSDYGMVSWCYNSGNINVATSGGGISGFITNTLNENAGIFNCYNIGKIENQGIQTLGNIVGELYGTVNNCYFSREICNLNGIGYTDDTTTIEIKEKTIDYMKTSSFVNDLNKDEEVFIISRGLNDGYPVLKWQVE